MVVKLSETMLRLLGTRSSCYCVRHFAVLRDMKYDQGPSFYVIPEIPQETSLKKKIVCADGRPNFTEITPELAFNGFSRLLIDHQLSLSKLSERLMKNSASISVHDVLRPLKEIFYPVEQAFEALKSISLYSDDPMWALINGRLFQKLKTSRTDYFCLDPEIYQSLLHLSNNGTNMDAADKELIEALIYECWRQGANFALTGRGSSRSRLPPVINRARDEPVESVDTDYTTKKDTQHDLDRIRIVLDDLAREEEQFQAMVMGASAVTGTQGMRTRLSGRLPDPSDLAFVSGSAHIPIAESDLAPSAPPWLITALGGRLNGGHVADMHVNLVSDPVVETLLKHCGTRQVRYMVWNGWVKRSSLRAFGGSTGQHASNDARMQTIRRARHRLANLLGCDDWLDVIWRGVHLRSPSSPESLVQDYLEPLRVALQPLGKQEWQLLNEWASSNLNFRGTKLETWDVDYAIEQYNYAATYTQLQVQLIPNSGSVTTYVATLLDQLANMFQLRVISDPMGSKPGEKSTDLARFRIEDSQTGSHLGHVILDLFAKPNRPVLLGSSVPVPMTHTWGVSTKESSSQLEDPQPMVTLLSGLPLTSQTEGVKVQDLLSIAAGFGACLQRILPRAYYHHLSGTVACLAADMRYIVADLCATLMYSSVVRPRLLAATSSNANSGGFYTDPATGIRPPSGRIVVLPLLRQLYEARFDLSLWSDAERLRNWITLNEHHWASHLPYPQNAEDFWPCSASRLFGPNSEPGVQYQHVWRQIVLQDVLSALEEHGWPNEQNPAVLDILRRFRDVIIVAKDLQPPATLFREFRGRDPSLTPLLQSIRQRTHPVPVPLLHSADLAASFARE